MREVVINAAGKSPGRIATEAVRVLLGKDTTDWAPNRLPQTSVVVTNAKDVRVSARKLRGKVYRRHSGAPGGFREEPFARVFTKKPEEIIRHAVHGMLPKNRLRAQALKRLKVFAGERG